MATLVQKSQKKVYQGKRKIKSSYKRAKDSRRASSSTPGKVKGDNCKKTPNKILFVKDTRLHEKNPKLYHRIWADEFASLHK